MVWLTNGIQNTVCFPKLSKILLSQIIPNTVCSNICTVMINTKNSFWTYYLRIYKVPMWEDWKNWYPMEYLTVTVRAGRWLLKCSKIRSGQNYVQILENLPMTPHWKFNSNWRYPLWAQKNLALCCYFRMTCCQYYAISKTVFFIFNSQIKKNKNFYDFI